MTDKIIDIKDIEGKFPPAEGTDGAVRSDSLTQLGGLSERLVKTIGEALDDPSQFKRFIVAEKSKNREGDHVTESVEKIFGKVDFKSVKEAACAISAVADSVKAIFSTSGTVSDDGGDGITVTFESGEEYAM